MKYNFNFVKNYREYLEDVESTGRVLQFIQNGPALTTPGNSVAMIAQDAKNILVIDCGERAIDSVYNMVKDFANIRFYITHTHMDHIGGLSTVIYQLLFGEHKLDNRKIEIVCNSSIIGKVDSYMDISGLTDFDIKLTTVSNTPKYFKFNDDDYFTITSILHKHAPGVDTGSMVYHYNDKIVYFSGDIAEITDYDITIMEECDEIYCDALIDGDSSVHISRKDLYNKIKDCKFVDRVFGYHNVGLPYHLKTSISNQFYLDISSILTGVGYVNYRTLVLRDDLEFEDFSKMMYSNDDFFIKIGDAYIGKEFVHFNMDNKTLEIKEDFLDNCNDRIMDGILRYTVPTMKRGLRDGDIIEYNGEVGLVKWDNYAYRLFTKTGIHEPVGLFLNNTNFKVLYRTWVKQGNKGSNISNIFVFRDKRGNYNTVSINDTRTMVNLNYKGTDAIFKYYEDIAGYALTIKGKSSKGIITCDVDDIINNSIYLSTYTSK